MNQFGNNQVYPAYSNPNYAAPPPPNPGAFVTQQQYQQLPPSPSGGMLAVQPSYYLPAPQVRLRVRVLMPGEEEGENPCGCCCGLEVAAKVMVLINLTMYVGHLGFYIYRWAKGWDPPEGKIYLSTEAGTLFRECTRLDDEGTRKGGGILAYWVLILTLTITYLLDLVISILFVNATFMCSDPVIGQRIQYSSWYMWYHLSFPGAIWTVIDTVSAATKYVACAGLSYVWITMFFLLAVVIPFDYYDGMVGRAYRNALRRASQLPMNVNPGEVMPMQTPSTGMVMGSGPGGAAPEKQASGMGMPMGGIQAGVAYMG